MAKVNMMRAVAVVALLLAFLGFDSSRSFAFDLSTHRTILLDALYRSQLVVGGEPLSFNLDVVMKIDDENGALDRGSLLSSDPLWHVDDEKVAGSNQRIMDLRAQIVSKLSDANPQFDSARALLGRALHILTDFYAHSNWIELHGRDPSGDFGARPLPDALAQPAEVTCAEDGATLTSAGLTKLTTGYYGGVGSCNKPAGKCRHGGPAACKIGLAKDPSDAAGHADAVAAATSAAKTFVQDLLNEVVVGGHRTSVRKFAQTP